MVLLRSDAYAQARTLTHAHPILAPTQTLQQREGQNINTYRWRVETTDSQVQKRWGNLHQIVTVVTNT
jgi:hypothetical protein